MSIPNDMSTYEKMANMKNILGDSFLEIFKQNIKSNQNENVIKMLDIAKDKPDTYIKLFAIAILYQNLEIIKHIKEKFNITKADILYTNSLSFYNSIVKDNPNEKINEPKENYIEEQCPLIIVGGIGGNIDIFKYLLDNNLISDKKEIGLVGLTRKNKNMFYSNVIGACAYYGNSNLMEFLLKNYKNELDLNFQATEKKSKINARVRFNKEYKGFTPCMLSVCSRLCSDAQTVEIFKVFKNYNINYDVHDSNKDNLLHLAIKAKKIETVKYLVETLDLKKLMNELNEEGYSPLSLSQHLNENNFISYFSEKNGIDEQKVEENIQELINESEAKQSKKKKKKKNKNNDNDIPSLLNSSEYQETLKVPKSSNKTSYDDNSTTSNSLRNNYNKSKTFSSNTSSNVNNRDKLHALLDNTKLKKKKVKDKEKEKQDIKEEKKFEEIKEEEKEKEIKEEEKEEETKEVEKENNINKKEPEGEIIIGLSMKKNKKKKGKGKTKENDNNDKIKEEEEKKRKEEEERIKEEEERIKEEEKQKELELEELRKKQIEEERRKEEEERKRKEEEERKRKEEEEERKRKEEEENRRKEEERKRKEEEERRKKEEEERKKLIEEEEKRKKEEEEERKKKEEEKKNEEQDSKNKEEEEEDYSYSDEENFLEEKEEKKEKEENNIPVDPKEFDKLNKNYLELERKITLLEKEKEELSSCLKNLYLEYKSNTKIPLSSNNEENINDLLSLANEELEIKNNTIKELENKAIMADLKNIDDFSKEKLQEYKNFYTKNLKLINDAINKY